MGGVVPPATSGQFIIIGELAKTNQQVSSKGLTKCKLFDDICRLGSQLKHLESNFQRSFHHWLMCRVLLLWE